MMRRRKVLLGLVAAILSLSFTVFGAEMLLRFTGHSAGPGLRTASNPTFDEIPGIFEPNQDIHDHRKPHLEYHITINALGFRTVSDNISIRKDDKRKRILCLGDSFTFGAYVNDEETFPYYLEKNLTQVGLEVEVINGGVESTTIVDQLYFLQKSLILSPDIVILAFYENDIDDLVRAEPMYVRLARNRSWKSAPIIRPLYFLIRDSALFDFALFVRAEAQFEDTRKALDHQLRNSGEDSLWKSYEESLRKVKSLLEGHSIPLILAAYPSWKRIAGRPVTGPDRVERFLQLAEKLKIPAVDLVTPLQGSHMPAEKLYLLPHDDHPSRQGHSIVANTLAEYLVAFLHNSGFGRKD